MLATERSVIAVSTNVGQTALRVTPVPADLGGGRAHQADGGVLGGGVGGGVGRADASPAVEATVTIAPRAALAHPADDRARAEERAGGVDVEVALASSRAWCARAARSRRCRRC